MRQGRLILLIGLLGIVFAAFSLLVTESSEPSYNGQRLTYWLGIVRTDQNGSVLPDDPATKAIRAMGPKTFQILLKYVADRDTPTKRFVMKLERKFRWFPFHPYFAAESHIFANNGFRALGTNALPVLPKLARLLDNNDFDVRQEVCRSIAYMGPAAQPAVPALIKEFKREAAEAHGGYAPGYALAKIGTNAKDAIPVLKAALNNQSREYRFCAQAALLNLNIPAPPEYYQQLTNVPVEINKAIILANWCGTNAAPALPVLVAALKSTNIDVQIPTLESIGLFHLQPEICVPAIVPFLQSSNLQLRLGAMESLKKFGQSAKQAGPAVAACLKDADEQVRDEARIALPAINPDTATKLGLPLGPFYQ